jgi:uncharacterized protein with NRDE domain
MEKSTNVSKTAAELVTATMKTVPQMAWDNATKDEINRGIRDVCNAAQNSAKYWKALVLIRENLAEMIDDDDYEVMTSDLIELLAIAHDALTQENDDAAI